MKATQADTSAVKWALIVIGSTSMTVVPRDVFGSLVDLFQRLAQEVAVSKQEGLGTDQAM